MNLAQMGTIRQNSTKKQAALSERSATSATQDTLSHLAFDNSLQPNIITMASNGKIIMANSAACKLLGYSKKDLLTKNRSTIFDIKEASFKKMLRERTTDGHSTALVTAIKKNGKIIRCEITSAIFIDEGIEKAITTIADISQRILEQHKIDAKKEKIVSDNISLAKSKQEKIDHKKEKLVAHDIILAQHESDDRLAENNQWIKDIAKTSYDVMWDWDIASGLVYIGDSVEEVFGYKLTDNTVRFTDFTSNLLPEDKEAVEQKLFDTLASGAKSWNDSFPYKRKDGSVASTTIRASIIQDDKGKAIRLIGAIQDVSRLEDLEKELEQQMTAQEELSAVFLMATSLSFDVIWDWNLVTNEVFIGEGFEELLGYSLKNGKRNIAEDWKKHLHPDERERIRTALQQTLASTVVYWEQSCRFIRADGSIANIFNRANIIRDAKGKACRMIGAGHDLSRQKELEGKLAYELATKRGYKESFALIFNSSADVLFDVDLITNEVIISHAYEKEFGYKVTSEMRPVDDWASHIHPDDQEAVMKDFTSMLASDKTEWTYSYRFLRADNSVANVISSRIVLRNEAGVAYRMIGSMQDVDKQTALEETLVQAIKLKEKQIADALEDAKEAVRSDIGKELHDNVNQLLGASKLYLEMAKRGGPNSEMYLSRSSQYTMTAIEDIRKLTKGLTSDIIKTLGLSDAIDSLARDTMEVNPVKISCALETFIEQGTSDKFKLNVLRIVQEQLNNILKHAKATEVAITLFQNPTTIILTIADNGIGFDTQIQRRGIGLSNIKSRATNYQGMANFISNPGKGCVLTVTFPVVAMLDHGIVDIPVTQPGSGS